MKEFSDNKMTLFVSVLHINYHFQKVLNMYHFANFIIMLWLIIRQQFWNVI